MKYVAPGTAPENQVEFRAWVLDELARISTSFSEVETDTAILKEWNEEPAKLYNGLLAYADGSNWDPGLDRGLYAYLNGTWQIATPVVRSVRFRMTPGGTPGTNITIGESAGLGYNYNQPTLTGGVNVAKSGSDGSYALDAAGEAITVSTPGTMLGILSSVINIHDINSSSTSEMYTAFAQIVANELVLKILKRGSVSAADWTSIMDAGDRCDYQVAFVTSA